MSEDTDFPWKYVYEHRESEVIRMERLRVWLKRCMEDFPDTEPVPDWWTSRFTDWFEKWFSEFKLKDEKT